MIPLINIFKTIIRKTPLKKLVKNFLAPRRHFPKERLTTYFKRVHPVKPQDNNELISYSIQFKKIINKIKINYSDVYVYPLDKHAFRIFPERTSDLASITPDFSKILDSDITKIKSSLFELPDSDYKNAVISTIDTIEQLSDKISKEIKKYGNNNENERIKTLSKFFPGIIYNHPKSLDEALQKLLFYNALFWQMRHNHIGLGRLDLVLLPYFTKDINNGIETRETAKLRIKDFLNILHRDIYQKSLSILGDTGQYILLGGKSIHDKYLCNDLTEIFLEIFEETPYADPKLIVRVNSDMPDLMWDKAIASIIKGSGSPLLMNESLIMKNMVEFGYRKEDVIDLGTSACWEPLIIGKSFDQNNPIPSISLLKPFTEVIISAPSDSSYEDLWRAYLNQLSLLIRRSVPEHINFDVSPLFSIFSEKSINNQKDFSRGGAEYSFHGIQMIGLANTVNSLLNIKTYVFDKKILLLENVQKALKSNYEGYQDIRLLFQSNEEKFGTTNPEVVELTNSIMNFCNEIVENLTCNGEKLKLGFSSPSYIWTGSIEKASADGRMDGEPLAVHISPISSNIDIAEILDFATKLEYSGNRLNGNVVDFILPQAYINQREKFRDLIKQAFKDGIFELQLNVLEKETLIDAKAHPENYPNLIVRVWGFSAYFNDLPESFKDNLISRATVYEK